MSFFQKAFSKLLIHPDRKVDQKNCGFPPEFRLLLNNSYSKYFSAIHFYNVEDKSTIMLHHIHEISSKTIIYLNAL